MSCKHAYIRYLKLPLCTHQPCEHALTLTACMPLAPWPLGSCPPPQLDLPGCHHCRLPHPLLEEHGVVGQQELIHNQPVAQHSHPDRVQIPSVHKIGCLLRYTGTCTARCTCKLYRKLSCTAHRLCATSNACSFPACAQSHARCCALLLLLLLLMVNLGSLAATALLDYWRCPATARCCCCIRPHWWRWCSDTWHGFSECFPWGQEGL
mmetsp:Transcript_10326/g.22205  ORF Transcript_10326/g.22205 Transcript_10326/m.22205 type:complete len:208 (+) Transcript_10326:99-722(+)